MATLINLPHEVQGYIANFLRNPDNVKTPFEKAPQIANIQRIHRNLETVPLWKNFKWKERIRKWRDENLTKLRWKYQYGTLPDKMIKQGWESKINNDYRHQNCYVETMFGETVGTGFVDVPKEYKVIWFKASLRDLITGVRPLPHCFGSDGGSHYRATGGNYQLTMSGQGTILVPAPSLETLIPINKRREWLIECFMQCVLVYWGDKMVEKNGGAGEKPDFIKGFKSMMELPSDYELSQTDLFKMFLRELQVRSSNVREIGVTVPWIFKRSQNIEDLCRQEINLVK